MVKGIERIGFAYELDEDFLRRVQAIDKDFPFHVFNTKIDGHNARKQGQDHQPDQNVFFIEHKSNLNTKDINLI